MIFRQAEKTNFGDELCHNNNGADSLKHTVYLDILFCVNFIVDYTILLSVKKCRGLPASRLRLLCGGLTGAAGSLVLLLPAMPVWLSWSISVLEALCMTAAAFLPMRLSAFLKAAGTLFLISFCYCGIMTAVLAVFSPKNLLVRNSTVYIGISPLMLIIMTLLCYIVMKLMWKLSVKKNARMLSCDIEICHRGKKINLKGTIDTGNTLHEPFSGECVIVGKAHLFKDMFDVKNYMTRNITETVQDGVRFIPFHSIGGNGLIPSFKPSKIYIRENARKTEIHAYLALCSEEYLTDECALLVPAELVMKGS